MLSLAGGVVRKELRRVWAVRPRGGSDWLHANAGRSWWRAAAWLGRRCLASLRTRCGGSSRCMLPGTAEQSPTSVKTSSRCTT
ncbi:hypothetical protein AV530_004995 [Patagioenas fasciata monilis]|uniref:Uncharacterized protein n=1 Tax=Patagioenas fasciata monilis TaxID=372326 RepID=A0A1V4K3W0_PATFA|nr:hypothetical protein AV530_004995 [Patagioenas fasciata monilis]